MKNLFIFFGIVIALAVVVGILKTRFKGEEKDGPKYQYKRHNFFLTRAEHEFYDVLVSVVGFEYFIFAQVHLPTLLNHTVKGQNWRAAFAHINGKSVDFVLCDKINISPKLAIELDDKSHERPDRQERDKEVDRILQQSGVPLLRIEKSENFVAGDLALKIKAIALK